MTLSPFWPMFPFHAPSNGVSRALEWEYWPVMGYSGGSKTITNYYHIITIINYYHKALHLDVAVVLDPPLSKQIFHAFLFNIRKVKVNNFFFFFQKKISWNMFYYIPPPPNKIMVSEC